MFSPISTSPFRGRVKSLCGSLAAHGVLLVWLLHAPSPQFLAPSSVSFGTSVGSVGRLYWTPDRPSDRADSSASSHEAAVHPRLTWAERSKRARHDTPRPSQDQKRETSQNAPPAGTPYGSLAGGPASGDEVRPALPVSAQDPVVDPTDLPGGVEGSVVIEITIDASGNVVQRTVLQSLGPTVDNKVLAAVENWHFRPATRNGVAIPSKQDVYYHFRPHG